TPAAAALVSADDDDRGQIQARRGHQVRGSGLVAGGQEHDSVEHRPFDGGLDVVNDEVPGGHEVSGFAPGTGDEIAWRGCANVEREPAGFADRVGDAGGYAVKVREAHRQLRGRIDDRDLRL